MLTTYVSGVFHFSGNIVEIPPDISPVMEEYMKFLQKMKKTAQKIYAMEWTKIHERIEEKKREATQQHSLQLSRDSRYFA